MPTAFATSGTSARRNGLAAFSSPMARGRRRLAGGEQLRHLAARAQRAPCCPARWSWRSGCWPACIRGRSRACVSSGSARSFSIDCHIFSIVPSITRPQPIENSVSPANTSLSAGKKSVTGRRCGRASRSRVPSSAPTRTVSPSRTVSSTSGMPPASPSRRDHAAAIALLELRDAAGVVAMMVGHQDVGELPAGRLRARPRPAPPPARRSPPCAPLPGSCSSTPKLSLRHMKRWVCAGMAMFLRHVR